MFVCIIHRVARYLMLASLFLLSEASDSVSGQSCGSAGDLPALLCLLSVPFSTSELMAHMHKAATGVTGASQSCEGHANSRRFARV